MKLTPQSIAFSRAAIDSASSTCPQAPPIAHAPKLISDTFQPVRPKSRYCIPTRIASVDQAVADGEADQFIDAVEVQLFHNAAAMRVHRIDAEVQDHCNLFIRLALGK